mgnify:CR=1 FL=1
MLQDKRDIWLVPLCIFIVYIVWGTTYLGNAWGVKVIPPFMFSGIRFLVAGSVLLLISSFFSPIEITWKQFKNLAFAGLLLFGVGNGLVTWALQYVDSGITALVISLEPLVVALMLWGYKKQKPQNNTWIGIGLGIFGMALLVGQPRFVSSWEWIIGFSFIFMAMLAWGYISIWIASADLPKSVFQSASLQMILGGLMLLASSFGMQEIQNFDWSKNLRFISYAVWWIKQSIIQSLNENSRMIRLPVNVVQDLQKAKKESQKNNTELDSRFTSLPKVIDLDMNINEEGDTLVDLIENTNAVQPDEGFNTAEMLKEKLRDIMKILDERERLIVEDYFGLSGTPRTLEDIGQDFNLTKERVRQIKEKALRKLRNESSVLFDYL